ncbi:MAG: hypothetical protein D6719_08565 [Candidatus Dadabacteria bacterium]|nr:MAG: hypothetical protein D6719_08565 [Candidatus Dadabacteria bacterium]
MILGFVFALATILLFGSWPVPTHLIEASPPTKALWLTTGHFVLSLIVFAATDSSIPVDASVLPLSCGAVWGIGMICGFVAIKNIGVTRGIGLWVPVVILTSAAWGLFFFGEWWSFPASKLLFSGVAIVLVLTAVFLVILSKNEDTPVRNLRVGIASAIALGLAHGSYFIPLHESNYSIFATFLPLSVGMIVITCFYAKLTKSQINHGAIANLRMLSAGALLGGGNYMALLTIDYLGVALGYPLTQLGIVINTLWGIFYFGEVQTRKSMVYISVGIFLIIMGALLMSFVQA